MHLFARDGHCSQLGSTSLESSSDSRIVVNVRACSLILKGSCCLLATALLGCEIHSRTNTAGATPSGSVHLFHSAWQGLDFSYPEHWKSRDTVHAAVNLEGPRDCSVFISAMVPNGPETPEHNLADAATA